MYLYRSEALTKTSFLYPFREANELCSSFTPFGRGGIRTLGNRKATPVFKTGAFDHSATLPKKWSNSGQQDLNLRPPVPKTGTLPS